MTDILPLEWFQWLEDTALAEAVQQSVYAFALIESVHLLGLATLGGAILVVDMRMLGLGLTRQGIGDLSRYARPWALGALGVMVVTGIPLFLSEAVKCYFIFSFWVKILTLPVALAFTFGVRERIARRDGQETSWTTRAVGLFSLSLWFTVAAAGRWIGFSG